MILGWFFVFLITAHSDQVAEGKSDLEAANQRSLREKYGNQIYDTLMCIQTRAPQELLSNPKRNKANCMFRALAPALAYSIQRRNMSNAKVALIFSQMMKESQMLTELTETSNFSAHSGNCERETAMLGQLISSLSDNIMGLVDTKSYAGKWIGRTPMQITGFDNWVSSADVLVQEFSMGLDKPEYKNYWEFPMMVWNPKTKKFVEQKRTLGPKPSQDEIEQFLDWYQSTYRPGVSLNIYNILGKPELLGTPELLAKDKHLGEMNSSILVSEFSFAYTDGRCADPMAKAEYVAGEYEKNSFCQMGAMYDQNKINNQNLDKCILYRGKTMKETLKCVKGSRTPEEYRELIRQKFAKREKHCGSECQANKVKNYTSEYWKEIRHRSVWYSLSKDCLDMNLSRKRDIDKKTGQPYTGY